MKFVYVAIAILVIFAFLSQEVEALEGAVGGQLPGPVCCYCQCRNRATAYYGNRLAQMMPTFLGKYLFSAAKFLGDCASRA